ncbi:MAG: hypothetical protein JO121_18475 [Deltaproteobacteria bacterium]|nr:hypothetical protein [Deltaproteobacteria bacterium]
MALPALYRRIFGRTEPLTDQTTGGFDLHSITYIGRNGEHLASSATLDFLGQRMQVNQRGEH